MEVNEMKKNAGNVKDTKQLGAYGVGDTVVVRAIPHHYIGTIAQVTPEWLIFEPGAVWLASSARWNEGLLKGVVDEAEAFPDTVQVARAVIGDVTAWRHPVPTTK